jgi:hypothetical protein
MAVEYICTSFNLPDHGLQIEHIETLKMSSVLRNYVRHVEEGDERPSLFYRISYMLGCEEYSIYCNMKHNAKFIKYVLENIRLMEMDLDLEYISTVTISHVQKTAYH